MKYTETKMQDFNVYYNESNKLRLLENHFHYNHELIFVKEGCADFIISEKNYVASENSLVIISNLEQHENVIRDDTPYKRYVLLLPHSFCLMIREPLLLSILINRPENFSHMISLDKILADKVTGFFDLFLDEFNEKKAFWDTRCAILLIDMLLAIYREKSEAFPAYQNNDVISVIINIQKYIANNLGNEITLDALAKHHFISKYHLSRKFREITGYNFKEYLILYRLNEAKKLLCNTEFSVSAIGQAIGYGDTNHFIRTFRHHEGVSPLQYRKKMIHSDSLQQNM